ncbi:MAG: hypothetical protein KDI75_05715 [Xanthomonadales bacterium]|nr:hypothetical protein [Xanthomonadales bacterium]
MRGASTVVLLFGALICTSAASTPDRVEVDLTYEPANPLEAKCEQVDPAGPNYDPVYRPPMRFPVDSCGITLREAERNRCEATVTVHFGKDRRVAELNVELKSGRTSCKDVLEDWVSGWRLCPDTPESANHLEMLMTLCGRPKVLDKPIEAAKPEKPSEPSPILDGVLSLFKYGIGVYDRIFGKGCGCNGKSSDD